MAKKNLAENGLTVKLDTVLKAVQSLENGATANELFEVEAVKNMCSTEASVRSSLARLDKTEGKLRSAIELNGEKTIKRYFAN